MWFGDSDFIGMTLEEIDWILCCMENNYNGGHYGDRIEYYDAICDTAEVVEYMWKEYEYYYSLEEKFYN